jgi:pSer/pThr/pTyr-binding forkhead associated (FHA) protein
VARVLWRDLRAVAAQVPGEIGRLVVVASVDGGPPAGGSYPLDAVTTLGRDVNNTIAVDDPFVSAEHAVLSYRGRVWYLEDRASANGTFVNGRRVEDPVPLAFGDEIQLGRVRFRLERPRPAKRL